ncbi:hypothetical protein EVAR_9622_1 [Eumeta japonica]|uniref:Uncharacterized protein n=1 Tax=Eumeta variegata TaxID=151549 RepID=A0A4C1TMN2_EUMVA|nr:hypothetical protein EVAR_9622_1 [Eumeta japonica]
MTFVMEVTTMSDTNGLMPSLRFATAFAFDNERFKPPTLAHRGRGSLATAVNLDLKPPSFITLFPLVSKSFGGKTVFALNCDDQKAPPLRLAVAPKSADSTCITSHSEYTSYSHPRGYQPIGDSSGVANVHGRRLPPKLWWRACSFTP